MAVQATPPPRRPDDDSPERRLPARFTDLLPLVLGVLAGVGIRIADGTRFERPFTVWILFGVPAVFGVLVACSMPCGRYGAVARRAAGVSVAMLLGLGFVCVLEASIVSGGLMAFVVLAVPVLGGLGIGVAVASALAATAWRRWMGRRIRSGVGG